MKLRQPIEFTEEEKEMIEEYCKQNDLTENYFIRQLAITTVLKNKCWKEQAERCQKCKKENEKQKPNFKSR